MVLLPWDSFSSSEVTGEITGQQHQHSRLPSGREHEKLQKTSLKNDKPVWSGVYLNENKLKHRSYSDNHIRVNLPRLWGLFPTTFLWCCVFSFTPTWGLHLPEETMCELLLIFFFPFLLSLHHNQHYSTKDKAFQEHVFLEVHNLLKTNTHYLSSSLQERDSHTPTCWLAQCWCLMSTLSILTETAVSGPIPSLFFWISKPAHKNPCLLHRQDSVLQCEVPSCPRVRGIIHSFLF